jgi:hypothetical protein
MIIRQLAPTRKDDSAMKKLAAIFLIGLFFSCTQQTPTQQAITASPGNSSAHQYKPGLGEIMSGIQTHHAKLWFAGINANWKLSEFEINEIREMFQTAMDFDSNRDEVKHISMIYSDLDSVSNAIKQQNAEVFKSSFQSLTNTCNSCHRTVNFEFNVITIPTAPPVTNQDFKVK